LQADLDLRLLALEENLRGMGGFEGKILDIDLFD